MLYPDFPQGGIIDVADYNDGQRGGRVRVRAKIETVPRRNMLRITEIPFGTTAGSIQDSIVAANEKGKIKVQKVEDNTAEFVEILVHLPGGTDPEQAIQALYAFTDCEVSISVNAVVIQDDKPRFITVTELLRESAAAHEGAAEARAGDPAAGAGGEVALRPRWRRSSSRSASTATSRKQTTWEGVIGAIWKGLKPYLKLLKREVTEDDVGAAHRDQDQAHLEVQLLRGRRAHQGAGGGDRRDPAAPQAADALRRLALRAAEEGLRQGPGAPHRHRRASSASPRRKSRMANETLYLDAKEGFAGIGLKKEGEPLGKCSTLDEVLFITREGVMSVIKVAPKFHVGKNPVPCRPSSSATSRRSTP